MQNCYYDGYKSGVEVTDLPELDLKGEITHATKNPPGSWHESKLAAMSGLLANKMSDKNRPSGFAI